MVSWCSSSDSSQNPEMTSVDIAQSVGLKLVDRFDLLLSSQQGDFKSEPIFIFKKWFTILIIKQ